MYLQEVENNTLYVKFVILAPHKQLPKEASATQKSAFEAENAFRDTVNEGKVFVSYLPSKDSKVKL